MKGYAIACLGLMVLAFLSVWQDYQVITLGKETERLRKKKVEMTHENNLLRFECQRLEEPGRLLHLNKTLKLQMTPLPPHRD